MAGFTDNYLKVRVANAPAELDNQIVNVRLTEIVTNPTTNEVEFLGEYQ
jgi:hypothetical protein